MKRETRERLRRIIDEHKRAELAAFTTCPNGYGAPGALGHAAGYKRGCRCVECRASANGSEARRRRREAKGEKPPHLRASTPQRYFR